MNPHVLEALVQQRVAELGARGAARGGHVRWNPPRPRLVEKLAWKVGDAFVLFGERLKAGHRSASHEQKVMLQKERGWLSGTDEPSAYGTIIEKSCC